MTLFEIQARLASAGLYGGAVDGRYGPRTAQAIEALFLARPYLHGVWRRWPASRRTTAAAQLFCMLDGIEIGIIDGLMGPQTRHAFAAHAARMRGAKNIENWRDDKEAVPALAGARNGLAQARGQTGGWPSQSQREMEKFFGPVGTGQTTFVLPEGYPMRIAWDMSKTVSRFSCHEKVHDAALRVLARVLDAYGPARIRNLGLDRFGGCLNVRRMRGGSAWSTHAWGAAFDFDPDRNQLKWTHARAQFARPEYERWWSLWEEEGFISLGRARDFDWMHVQAAGL